MDDDLKPMLENFHATMLLNRTAEGVLRLGQWWVSETVPAHDFNREIMKPGQRPDFPDGAFGIRTDDDFWAVAVLPYEFRLIPLPEVVALLWPTITDPSFEPDVQYNPADRPFVPPMSGPPPGPMPAVHPDLKTEYGEGDRVEFVLDGKPPVYKGKIVGIASRHILDHWIVQPDERLPDWAYSCVSLQHTFIRREGSNDEFLCQRSR